MSRLKIALAAGDGIGPEIMAATLDLFKAAGVHEFADFVPVDMGASEFAKGNSRGMSETAIRTVEDCGILFKGPMETPKGGGGKSINVTARKLWNAYANYRVFKTLPGVETVYSKAGINIDMIVQNQSIANDNTAITFTLPGGDKVKALDALHGARERIGFAEILYDDAIGKVSVIGVGMRSHPGVSATFFRALAETGINIQMISTSEIRISVVVGADDVDAAVRAAHTAFGLDSVSGEAVVYAGTGR